MLILILLCLFSSFSYAADATVPTIVVAASSPAARSIREPSSEQVERRHKVNQFHQNIREAEWGFQKSAIINTYPELVYEPYQKRSLLAYLLDEWDAAKYKDWSHPFYSNQYREAIEAVLEHGSKDEKRFRQSIKDACNFFAAHEAEMQSRSRYCEHFHTLELLFISKGFTVRPEKTKKSNVAAGDCDQDVEADVINDNGPELDLVDRFFIKVHYRHYGQAIELINQYPWLLNKCDDKGQSALTSAMVSWAETEVMTAKFERKLFILFVLGKRANIDIKGTNYLHHDFSSAYYTPFEGFSASDLMRGAEYQEVKGWYDQGADWCRREYEKLTAELQSKTPPKTDTKKPHNEGKQPEVSKSFLSSKKFKYGIVTVFLAGIVYYLKVYKKKEINTDFIEDEPDK